MADLSEVKDLIEAQGKARKAEIDVLESKTMSKAEAKEALDKINAEMKSIREEATKRDLESKKQLDAIEAKAGRPGAGVDEKALAEKKAASDAFAKMLRKGVNALSEAEFKAMNTGSDPDGGYLVLPEMDKTIDRIAPTISAMYRLANVVTIGTKKYEKVVKKTGMAMRRVADGGTGGETTEPTYAKLEIEVHTAEVEPWVFNETLEDAFIDLEADLADEAGIGFAEGAGSEFITGNGVGKARGIAAYSNVANASYAWGSVGYIVSGKSAAFASVAPADKLVDLQHALKAQYRPGAVWMMNDATLGTVRQMKDGSGSYYLWQPDPLGAFGGRLLGHPVEVDDNFAAVAAGSYSLAFINPKRAYTIVNRAGTTLIRDNITAKGTTKFNFRRRFGGGITHSEAVKLMKFAPS